MNLQLLLDKWKIKMDVNTLLSMWNESHRHYHNLDHLTSLLSDIDIQKDKLSEKEYEKLNLVALFHDIVYDPSKGDNEEMSAQFFIETCIDKDSQDIKDIRQAILDTKTHVSSSNLSEKFNKLDMSIVESDYDSLIKWEENIYKEFAFVGKDAYKQGRLAFLESLLDRYNHNAGNLLKLTDYVKTNY